MTYRGRIVDVLQQRIYDGEIVVNDGIITMVRECPLSSGQDLPYIMPGFIDSHVHIDSSMMMPVEFARVAAEHGTIGVVADPHEIANVLGVEGLNVMISSGRQAQFNFLFGAPSCVPAIGGEVETSGAVISSQEITALMQREDIGFLGEMMNFTGVLHGDSEVMAKISAARKTGKPIDGHAPGLTLEERVRYAKAGISTDHECATLDEGHDCIRAGMKVIIREGSAAKDYAALHPLLDERPDQVMLCTDDPMHDSPYPWHEVQKVVVYNRYDSSARPVVGLVRGFGIRHGAIASSVAHDCHNIIAIGSTDDAIVRAINRVIEMQGGQVAIADEEIHEMALPIAGLMSPLGGYEVAYRCRLLRDMAALTGCTMKAPFITMAFLCLPVIPELKITDKLLWDSKKMERIKALLKTNKTMDTD